MYFYLVQIKYIFFSWNGRNNICTRNWLHSEHMMHNIWGLYILISCGILQWKFQFTNNMHQSTTFVCYEEIITQNEKATQHQRLLPTWNLTRGTTTKSISSEKSFIFSLLQKKRNQQVCLWRHAYCHLK